MMVEYEISTSALDQSATLLVNEQYSATRALPFSDNHDTGIVLIDRQSLVAKGL